MTDFIESYESIKNKGEYRSSPDRRKNWKKYKTRSSHKKKIALYRNSLKGEINDFLGRKKPCKQKYIPYRDAPSKWKTLYHYQLLRSGKFCRECEYVLCDHRIIETIVHILLSKKKNNGVFAILPKELVLMIAKYVYKVQYEYLNTHNVPCIYDVLYLNCNY
jgi:hypothetical protein